MLSVCVGVRMALVISRSYVYIAALGMILATASSVPASAQQPDASGIFLDSTQLSKLWQALGSAPVAAQQNSLSVRIFLHHVPLAASTGLSTPFAKPAPTTGATTIDRMEAAFYCNDTPFVDQVRLPLASLWGGRLKVVAFESDVTTANFVLGLPGGGTLRSLGMFSSGHLATHTPPSDQLTGVHLTFNLRGSEVGSLDNSGLHGLQHVMRTSRDFFQSVTGR
jgi:hypothetical protein